MTADRIRIVTWNIWFGQLEQDARRRALWRELEALEPDVACLQEVLPEDLEHPGLRRLRDRGYWCSDEHLLHYDVLALARRGIVEQERLELPSQMGRNLLVARLDVEPGLTVATVHLESTAPMTEARLQQLRIIDGALADETDVVLVGDMNFTDDDAEETERVAHWCDVWPALRPDEPGFTVDSTVNEMRHLSKPKLSRKRIDRVFVRSEHWRASRIERLGTHPLPDDPLTFVSDHFGLVVDLVPVG